MFILILRQVIKMTIMLVIGFVIRKIGLVSHEGNRSMSNVLLMVVNPLVIFQSFLVEYTPQRLRAFGISTLLAVAAHVLAMVIAVAVFPRKGNRDFAVERLSAIFSNCGFMGIPLINAILGSEGILYLTPYMVVFNLLIWTYGLGQMTGERGLKQIRNGLLKPVTVGVALGLVMFLGRLHLPALAEETIGSIAAMNTPLAMLIAGMSLAESSIGEALTNARLYLVCALKLLVIPLLLLVIFRFLPIPSDILYVNLIAAACPVGSTCTLFALRYDGNYKYASEIFAVCTVLSMVTIPLFVMVMERVI